MSSVSRLSSPSAGGARSTASQTAEGRRPRPDQNRGQVVERLALRHQAASSPPGATLHAARPGDAARRRVRGDAEIGFMARLLASV